MNKNRKLMLFVCLLMVAVAGFTLLRGANDPTQEVRAAAGTALGEFTRYQETGEESAYLQGVAFFREFQQACQLLGEEERLDLAGLTAEVYRAMSEAPEAAKQHLDILVEALTVFSRNLEERDGTVGLEEYRDLVLGK